MNKFKVGDLLMCVENPIIKEKYTREYIKTGACERKGQEIKGAGWVLNGKFKVSLLSNDGMIYWGKLGGVWEEFLSLDGNIFRVGDMVEFNGKKQKVTCVGSNELELADGWLVPYKQATLVARKVLL